MTKATIISGSLHKHLKNIELVGKIRDGGFVVFGCKNEDQDCFYRGLLGYDKETGVHGWETVSDVEEYWMGGGDGMMLSVDLRFCKLCEEE